MHSDRNKLAARDRYLVVSMEGEWCNIKKFRGHQLRNTTYRVKRHECYKVPHSINPTVCHPLGDQSDDDDEIPLPTTQIDPPLPPPIPQAISVPPPPPDIASTQISVEHEIPEEASSTIDDRPFCELPSPVSSNDNPDQLRRPYRSVAENITSLKYFYYYYSRYFM